MRYAVALSTLALVFTAACTDGPTALSPESGTAPPAANSLTIQSAHEWALTGGCAEIVPGTVDCSSRIELGVDGLPEYGIDVYHYAEWTLTYECRNKNGRASARHQGTRTVYDYQGWYYTSAEGDEIESSSTLTPRLAGICPAKGAFTTLAILSGPTLRFWEVGADNNDDTQFRCIASRETPYGCEVPND